MERLSRARFRDLLKLQISKERRQRGLLIVPGQKCVQEVLQSSWQIDELLLTASGEKVVTQRGLELPAHIQQTFIHDDEAARLCAQRQPEGLIALVRRPENILGMEWNMDHSPSLLLDGVADPGNMGSILRTAAWFGLQQIALRGDCCAVDSIKVVRSAMGALFRMERIAPFNESTVNHKFAGRVLVLDGQSNTSLADFQFRQDDLLVMGSESHGSTLPDSMVDDRLAIPGNSGLDSLNVGHAFAMVAWERVRQLGAWS